MASWYRVRERCEAEAVYYVQAESPSDAKRRVRQGDDYLEGRAAWSGSEPVGAGRIVGRAEPVDELPKWAVDQMDGEA